MPERMLRDWTDSVSVNALSVNAEVLFTRLIMKADDFGRFHGNPRLLKSLLFPLRDGLRDADISHWLDECEAVGILRVYTDKVSGKPFIEIRNFGQRLRTRKAKYPDENGSFDPQPADKCPQPADKCPQPADKCRLEVEVEEEVEDIDNSTPRAGARVSPYPRNNPEGRQEVEAAAHAIGYNITPETAEQFIAHYEALGWLFRGQPIRNWKSLLVAWRNTERNAVKPKKQKTVSKGEANALDKYGI